MPALKFTRTHLIYSCLFMLIPAVLAGCSLLGGEKRAALQVTSQPEASVFLDGKHLGKTPFSSDQLKVGEHTLKITIAEASFIDKISLTSGTLTVVNRELNSNFLAQSGETLSLDPDKKGLSIASHPQEAEITLDGRLIAQTPILIEDLPDGEHKIELTKEGYIKREFTVKTSKKYRLLAEVTLASQVAKKIASEGPIEPVLKVKKIQVIGFAPSFVQLRQEPLNTSREIGRAKPGDQLEVLQETKDWIKVKFEDKQGWIMARYTKTIE